MEWCVVVAASSPAPAPLQPSQSAYIAITYRELFIIIFLQILFRHLRVGRLGEEANRKLAFLLRIEPYEPPHIQRAYGVASVELVRQSFSRFSFCSSAWLG